MEEVKTLITLQYEIYDNMTKFIRNYKKDSKDRKTQAYFRTRLSNFSEYWLTFKANHNNIILQKVSKEDPYVVKEYYTMVEDYFINHYSEIENAMEQSFPPVRTKIESTDKSTLAETVVKEPNREVKLPRIQIPEFSGNYEDWASFHDLFDSVIHSNTSLSDVQKLYYLKSSVTGEAEKLIKHFASTSVNYVSAWDSLKERYENPRVLVNVQLKRLFSQSKIQVDNAQNVKSLLDTTKECLAALQNLKVNTDHWDPILIHILVQKLSSETLQLWEQSLTSKKDIPTFEQLKSFLESRFRTLEAITTASRSTVKNVPSKSSCHVAQLTCVLCNSDHYINKCPIFIKKPRSEKIELVKAKGLCFNCLSNSHSVRQCPSKNTCNYCRRKHHTQLHESIAKTSNPPSKAETSTTSESSPLIEIASHLSQQNLNSNSVLLATALVKVSNDSGKEVLARALLDQGSQTTFISEYLTQTLNLKKKPILAQVSGIGNSNLSPCYKFATINISSTSSERIVSNVDALVMKSLSNYGRYLRIKNSQWEHIRGLKLADPKFGEPGKIDLIIGADLYPSILLDGCVKGVQNTPVAQNTKFGWILTGPTHNIQDHDLTSSIHITNLHSQIDLHNQMRAFWEIEEIPQIKGLTEEENRCEEIFKTTVQKKNGRYTVNLPFKDKALPLGESRSIAVNRFKLLENRLQKNPTLASQYSKCLEEYLELNHMVKIKFNEIDLKVDEQGYHGYYLPHHAVLKEDSTSTKLRVVFNASQKTTTGVSLNDKLMTGPNIQESMFAILHRWRFFKIAYTADLEKMYRQIRVATEQTNYQRIVWRRFDHDPIEDYKLTTVTFGMDCSAYLAIRTLKQLAVDQNDNFPLGANSINHEFYVDNLMSGASDIDQALEKQAQVIDILKEGRFTLRKWASNEPEILKNIPSDCKESNDIKGLNFDHTVKTLGFYWNTTTDTLGYKIKFQPVTDFPTKRSILSDISKLYDPLGWISPITITGKILIQILWLAGLNWDDKVNQDIQERWLKFVHDLYQLETIKIPRWIGLNIAQDTKVEIHAFSDSSTQAYAAVIYIRIETKDQCITRLLSAKTRIAPVKPVTLPRLELCAAVLSSKLTSQIISDMKLSSIENIFAWSDSTIVLAWLRGQPSRWKSFVANRVGEIYERLPDAEWRYVPSKSNPADLPTRGIKPQDLSTNSLWWNGPPWLSMAKEQWPEKIPSETTDLEKKETKVSHSTQLDQFNLLNKFSSLTKLIRVTAFCIRFRKNCKLSKPDRLTNSLTATELKEALIILIRHAQKCDFGKEIDALQKKKHVHSKSKLLPLHPFLDDQGIIRVGGRLQNAQITFSEKHPIILSPTNPLSNLLISKAHKDTLHGGIQLTLGILRRKYWILNARNKVKKIIHECISCWRQKAKTSEQLMGNLPVPRVTSSRPFTHTGVDYFGPLEIKMNKSRNSKTSKAYASLFICLTVKAVHLELVSDMTSEAFLAAFRRFTSRRGLCSDLYSDQGTNFKGAASIIKDDFSRCIKQIEHQAAETLTNDQITWHFIPPYSPHFGGLWEAGVKSTKHHLKRILGNSKLTFEEMSTLLAQIEATLNSRPLCALTDNPDDVNPLTPGHFLVGDVLTLPPEPNILTIAENRLNRWQRIQQLHQNFWTRWRGEYLRRLQTRPKWLQPNSNLQVGELILIKDEQLPPAKWALGRVLEVHKGKDGLARVATIRTKGSTFVRPITKICKLPFNNHACI